MVISIEAKGCQTLVGYSRLTTSALNLRISGNRNLLFSSPPGHTMVKTPFERTVGRIELQRIPELIHICFSVRLLRRHNLISGVRAIWADHSVLVKKLGHLFNGAKNTYDFGVGR